MVFAAALVLMMNILGLKRSGGATNANVEKDLALVGKSIEMLRALRFEYVRRPNVKRATTKRSGAAQNAHLGNTGVRAFVICIHRLL